MHTPQNILDKAKALKSWLITHRRHLHKHPELSFREVETKKYIRHVLQSLGLSISDITETGLATTCHGANSGPYIALRADMDALPVQENTAYSYASVNRNVMHACGHDVHMTCLLGALHILNDLRSEFSGNVLGVFQPGEEILPGGAIKVIESGIFDKYKPRLIIGQHVMPGQATGTLGFRPGHYMASTDEIYISVKGNGGHIAVPSLTQDVVSAAAEIVISLKQKVTKEAGDIPVVIGFGKTEAQGSTNLMPTEANLTGTFRTMDEKFRSHAKNLIHTIVEQIAERYGAVSEINIIKGYPALNNHTLFTKEAMHYASELVGNQNIIKLEKRMTGEDFAHYARIMPAVFYRLGIAGNDAGENNVHRPDFDVDEEALVYGSASMAWLALKFLNRL
ncbi:MAG: M20 family metallopeptidase [Bacteroidota bacterium]|nr:M20 family metallopeptidase [Bacteroidota bacterium]